MRGLKLIEIPKKQLCHMYVELGMSSPDIAKEFKCCKPIILGRLKEYGIPVRNGGEAHNMPIYINKISQWSKGNKHWLGKKHTEKWKQEMSQRMMGNDYGKKNIGHPGWKFSDADREADRQAQLKRYQNPEERRKTSEAMLKFHRDNPEASAEQKRAIRINAHTPEAIAKRSESLKRLWANPERKARWIKAQRRNIKPTRPEFYLLSLLDFAYPDEWKYVGDGSVVFDNRNPDYININGKKLIIELFGDYYHSKEVTGRDQEEEISLREDTYANFGYSTLVIWQRELNSPEKVLLKISKFVNENIRIEHTGAEI